MTKKESKDAIRKQIWEMFFHVGGGQYARSWVNKTMKLVDEL